MKNKQQIKIVVDIFMTLVLLFLMGYQFWGDKAHEWVGAGMFLLFVLHHILNWKWYSNLSKGKYNGFRILQFLTNFALFTTMVCMMISGMMLSNHVFAFLPIYGKISFARILHMASVYWGFVLMSVHLGFHWMIFAKILIKLIDQKVSSQKYRIWMTAMGVLIASFGCLRFLYRRIWTYMLVQTQFVFLDFNEPVFLFYLDYLVMMGFFIFIGHVISNRMRKIKTQR